MMIRYLYRTLLCRYMAPNVGPSWVRFLGLWCRILRDSAFCAAKSAKSLNLLTLKSNRTLEMEKAIASQG